MGPGDFAVGELNFFQVREVRVRRILAVVHFVVDGDDDRVFQFGGVVVLLGTLRSVNGFRCYISSLFKVLKITWCSSFQFFALSLKIGCSQS